MLSPAPAADLKQLCSEKLEFNQSSVKPESLTEQKADNSIKMVEEAQQEIDDLGLPSVTNEVSATPSKEDQSDNDGEDSVADQIKQDG